MNVKESIKDHLCIVWCVVFIFVLIAGCVVGAYALKPTLLGFEREALQNSHQYVDSKVTAINKYVVEVKKIDVEIAKYELAEGDPTKLINSLESQKAALINRIKAEAAMLPAGEIPESAKEYLD